MDVLVTGLIGLVLICGAALALTINEEKHDKGGQP